MPQEISQNTMGLPSIRLLAQVMVQLSSRNRPSIHTQTSYTVRTLPEYQTALTFNLMPVPGKILYIYATYHGLL